MTSQAVMSTGTPAAGRGAPAGPSAPALLDGLAWPPAPARPRENWRLIGRLMLNTPLAFWLLFDTVAVWAGLRLGFALFPNLVLEDHVTRSVGTGVLVGSIVACSLAFGLYDRDTLHNGWRVMTRMVLTLTAAAVLACTIVFVIMYARISRRILTTALLTVLLSGSLIRLFAVYAVHKVRLTVLIVGSTEACRRLAASLGASWFGAYRLLGYVCDSPNPDGAAGTALAVRHLGPTRDLIRICRDEGVDEIVACNGAAASPAVMNWLLPCLRLGCRVTNEAIFHEKAAGQTLVDEITPDWFLFADLKSNTEEYALLKRVFDILVSLLGLLVTLPLYPLLALAIKLEDGGPVFYFQNRVGQNGTIFRLFKFRTMRPTSDPGPNVWAAPNDPRVTRVGRILRRTRLDEIPQFYNVLVGQMSVVGPRPEQPEIVAELCRHIPFWSERNLVKPGITGWAQISYHYGNTLADAKQKLQFDLYYIKHMSLELDFIILFRTLGTFLRGAC